MPRRTKLTMLQLGNTCWVKLEPSAAPAHALIFQCHRRSSNALTTHHSHCSGATECMGCVITRDNTNVVACAAPLNMHHLHERKQVVVRRKGQLRCDENAQSQGKSTLVSLARCSKVSSVRQRTATLVLVRMHNVVAWHHAQSPQQRPKCACTAMHTNHGDNVMPFGSAWGTSNASRLARHGGLMAGECRFGGTHHELKNVDLRGFAKTDTTSSAPRVSLVGLPVLGGRECSTCSFYAKRHSYLQL
jgi:hypothetical protein